MISIQISIPASMVGTTSIESATYTVIIEHLEAAAYKGISQLPPAFGVWVFLKMANEILLPTQGI